MHEPEITHKHSVKMGLISSRYQNKSMRLKSAGNTRAVSGRHFISTSRVTDLGFFVFCVRETTILTVDLKVLTFSSGFNGYFFHK